MIRHALIYIFGILIVTLIGSGAGASTGCDEFETPGDTDTQGRVIVLKQELCARFGYTDTRSIIILSPTGRRYLAFQYEPAFSFPGYHDKATPSVKWLSPGLLDISIGAVASIRVQRKQVGDVKIQYKIGEVLLKQ